eukprot:CAMPEP_0113498298 /NCGR_PEP_ID=MMETSP0014_2-20120614/31087_1 /TAXON_ID=2857 /ORGANISM="Nitzschia sp." /LENGTH=190 /DNA_ID=CAMNT_0000392291 /DNA_START=43 /DNA_END=615 /DNA_ORIENTATION=+ /assembly_acc=CAM_ASM_000159
MSILLSSQSLLASALTEDDENNNNNNNNGNNVDDVGVEEAMKLARENAKPWFLRELKYKGQRFLISPASIVCVLVFVVNLLSWLSYKTSGTWAEANHILVKATDAKTKKALTQMVQEIGTDLKKFGAVAEQYSSCPSSKEKGNLGRFPRGAMTPYFDKAVFDPKTPLKTTIGPIETQFGLHLIYIRDRKM